LDRAGVVGIPGAAAYAASKAAVRNHTETVALYCAQQRLAVRCNAILPAAILTPMWEPMLGTGPEREARKAALVADTPIRRCVVSAIRRRWPPSRSCWLPTKRPI
jgi:NAD(P)-dependent dehydrogenase (short-subunit alcohol dehydrogenase family)